MFGSYYGGDTYNPFLHSYLPERQYSPGYGYGRTQRDPYAEARARAQAEARARALAQERARRAQWLPDEDEDEEDEEDWRYNQLGPRERAYLDAMKRRRQLERAEQEREEAEKRLEEERWQEQLEQKQREEEVRRQRILEEQRRVQQQKREQARRQVKAANAQEKGQRRVPSPSRPREPTPPPRQPTPRPQYTEKHEEAASIIQTKYRVHRSLKHIRELEQTFFDAKQKVTFPTTLDFQRPGAGASDHDHVSVQVRSPPQPEGDLSESPMEVDEQPFSGKLAYTSTNYGLHAYMESLLKLLMQLDGVESWGDANVRKRRRAVVKEIEGEVSRVDAWWKNAWRDYLRGEEEEDRKEVEDEMKVREEPKGEAESSEDPEGEAVGSTARILGGGRSATGTSLEH